MSEPLVTVVIGTYRREAYIRRTLDSVFAQDWPALQVIVVDDASDDRTVEILRKQRRTFAQRPAADLRPHAALRRHPRRHRTRRGQGDAGR